MSQVVKEGTHILIIDAGHQWENKPRFELINKHDNDVLGIIAWFPKWKKYSFFPNNQTIFEEVCMREISDFIEQQTKEVKK